MKPSWKPFNEPSNLWELGDLTYFDHPISSPDCGHLLCQAHSSAQRLLSAARPRRSSRRGIVGWNIFWKAWKWVERCWGWSKLEINWTSFVFPFSPWVTWVDLSGRQWSFAIYENHPRINTGCFQGSDLHSGPNHWQGQGLQEGTIDGSDAYLHFLVFQSCLGNDTNGWK